MNKMIWLISLIFLQALAIAGWAIAGWANDKPSRTNVLLIMADDK